MLQARLFHADRACICVPCQAPQPDGTALCHAAVCIVNLSRVKKACNTQRLFYFCLALWPESVEAAPMLHAVVDTSPTSHGQLVIF